MNQRTDGIGRLVVALAVVVLVLGSALGYSLLALRSTTRTVTSTVTTVEQPTQDLAETLPQHLLVFTSGNVSAIVSQYTPTANVTWTDFACLSGLYPDAGNSSGDYALLVTTFFDKFLGPFPRTSPLRVFVGNTTVTSVTETADGAIVNSTFSLVGGTAGGNLTATISAEDSYVYSAAGTWLISGEYWHFLTYDITPITADAADCFFG